MSKKAYVVQDNGQVTLPPELREEFGLKKGDLIAFERREDGWYINPRTAKLLNALNEIEGALEAKGISLEDLIEEGDKLRQELYEKRYGKDG